MRAGAPPSQRLRAEGPAAPAPDPWRPPPRAPRPAPTAHTGLKLTEFRASGTHSGDRILPDPRVSLGVDGREGRPGAGTTRRSTRGCRSHPPLCPWSAPSRVLPTPDPPSGSTGVFPEGEQRGRVRRASGGGGAEGTASGVTREAFQPGDLDFPQISAASAGPPQAQTQHRNRCRLKSSLAFRWRTRPEGDRRGRRRRRARRAAAGSARPGAPEGGPWSRAWRRCWR